MQHAIKKLAARQFQHPGPRHHNIDLVFAEIRKKRDDRQ
jgi:hypothetical protein